MEQKHKNQILSHRILNYLNAGYQGKFTALNILSRLEHPEFKPTDITATKAALKTINDWLDRLWDGETLFEEERGARQTEEAQNAFGLLRDLQPELENLAALVFEILYGDLEREFSSILPKETGALIAAYGRNAYSRDNYVRGFVKFGEVFSDKELLKIWKPHLDEIGDNIKLANEFLQTFRDNPTPDDNFYQHLTFFCRSLPGVFRSHIHDIYQLLNSFEDEFGFDRCAFTRPEAVEWKNAKFEPIEAGYWRAHGYGAKQAIEWRDAGIPDPLTAAEWDTAGFSIEYAVEWMTIDFSPLLAIQWHSSDYGPQEAAIFVARGYYYPEMIPEGKADEILDLGFPGEGEEIAPPESSADE